MKKTNPFLQAVIAFMLLHTISLKAQTFNYSLSASSGTYQPLSGGTTLASGASWNSSGYNVPVGFPCTFAGKTFDTVTVAPNGFILFGNDNARAIATFKGMKSVADSTGTYSILSYKSETGYLKIEFKNVGFELKKPDNFNFQVWINAQGAVEFHTGNTTLSSTQDSLIMPVIGIINPSMDQSDNGYVIQGNPSQPTGAPLTGNELKYLSRVPDENTVYTLTPQ